MRAAMITGLSGLAPSDSEIRFLREVRPAGVILFTRNCATADQVQRLVAEATGAVGGELLILVDQEGGRVRRLRPPQWRELPAAAAYAALYRDDADEALRAARLVARLTAADLSACGINVNCAPVLDIAMPGAHPIVGDRAYGASAEQVARLGAAVADGHLAGGVLPVLKHMPGHGRAMVDSHLALPVVAAPREELAAIDFAPFRALRSLPAAMTAHVVYTALDAEAPASISQRVTAEIMRGEIGFDGLLMSDDLGMRALRGPMRARAEAVIRAGSDIVLHCSGDPTEMEEVAAAVPTLAGEPLRRFRRCLSVLGRGEAFSVADAEAALGRLLPASA